MVWFCYKSHEKTLILDVWVSCSVCLLPEPPTLCIRETAAVTVTGGVMSNLEVAGEVTMIPEMHIPGSPVKVALQGHTDARIFELRVSSNHTRY